jgi:phage N-6-adenine-methyltransferase
MAVPEVCQVWIEQRIQEELEAKGETGASLRSIGRMIADEVERLFEARVKPGTIKERARRLLSGTTVPPKSQHPETIADYEPPAIILDRMPQGGGDRRSAEYQTTKDVLSAEEREALSRSYPYVCHCGESFDEPVWHCKGCGYHWSMRHFECTNCYKQKAPERPHTTATNRPHVANNTGDNEWYSPQHIVDAARRVMGQIELDPASSEEANSVVLADKIYTATDSGLNKKWEGNVFLNPPYESALIGKFIDKLVESIEAKDVQEAVVLVNNATETKWFQLIATVSNFICFPAGRVKFWHPRKESTPLQGQAILYYGKNQEGFCEEFSPIGIVAKIID